MQMQLQPATSLYSAAAHALARGRPTTTMCVDTTEPISPRRSPRLRVAPNGDDVEDTTTSTLTITAVGDVVDRRAAGGSNAKAKTFYSPELEPHKIAKTYERQYVVIEGVEYDVT